MRIKLVSPTVGLAFCLLAGNAMSAPGDSGAAGGAGSSSCLQSPARLSDASVATFQASPGDVFRDVVAEREVTTLVLASRIRSLASSSSDTLDSILDLARTATPAQQAAIGAGLARAATVCVEVQPEYAARIQVAVASMNSPLLAEAFAGGLDDVQTSALGGAAAAGPAAAAIGTGGEAGGGSRGITPDDLYTNTVGTYSFSSRQYSRNVVVRSSVSPSDVTP